MTNLGKMTGGSEREKYKLATKLKFTRKISSGFKMFCTTQATQGMEKNIKKIIEEK